MLINFCRKCLQSSVTCSTISNDGYEVTNLTSDVDKGFLAYSCIKPPIHIDFTLIYDIQINHVVVWPSVGAQKSSGFELSLKFGDEYKRVSTAFLEAKHCGVLFYRRDVDPQSFRSPPNFLDRYMQQTRNQGLNRVKHLRISILRTENSVPAIGRVEIWGSVSRSVGKEAIEHVAALWQSQHTQPLEVEATNNATSAHNIAETLEDSHEEAAIVPECFLDPITCNIMIQPIVLPSGAIIDQSTLEKHGKTEATWGRTLSDPFTGVPFNDSCKPIIASALKARIDKYLLDNKHLPEVKTMPRLSGRKEIVMSKRNRSLDISEIMPGSDNIQSVAKQESLKRSKLEVTLDTRKKLPSQVFQSMIRQENSVHRLPIMPMCSTRDVSKSRSLTTKNQRFGISAFKKEIKVTTRQGDKDSNLERSVDKVLSNLQRFNAENQVKTRKCLDNCKCVSQVFYKLPCNHILCRDVVISIKNSRCIDCNLQYNSHDLERFHG